MSYSDIYLNRNTVKIPTVFFLVVIAFTSLALVKIFSIKPTTSQASKKTLKQVSVVNLSYNQAGVFWQTDKKETGWLIYGENENILNKTAIDEKDTADERTINLNHYVLLKNLKENQQYFFKIISDKQLISDMNNRSFVFRTPTNTLTASNISPAYGKVIKVNGSSLAAGAVIIAFKDCYPLLGLIKLSGEWLIPLNNVVDKTSNKIKKITNGELATIGIYSEEGETTTVEAIVDNLSPLPQTLVIGKNYNFTTKENVLAATDSIVNGTNKQIGIIFPKEEGIIPGESPLIKGTALPGAEVIVIINSEVTYSSRVVADKDGIWRLVPKDKLPPGKHTLTIITKNENNQEVKIIRQFTIAKSGEQVLGNATPEPTLTEVPTPTPMAAIVVTPSVMPSSTTPPTSGFNPAYLTVISGGFIIVGLGIILAF